MKKTLAICLLLLSQQAYAEEPFQWLLDALKVDNPNQLRYFAFVGETCPISRESVEKAVEGVFIRSRIKPLNATTTGFITGEVHLDISVTCLEKKEGRRYQEYIARIAFGRAQPEPSILYDYMPWSVLGRNDGEGIRDEVKDSVENAITVFIKANFVL
jgi:hypothetical protein